MANAGDILVDTLIAWDVAVLFACRATASQQDVDLVRVFNNVAVFNAHVTDAAHMGAGARRADRPRFAARHAEIEANLREEPRRSMLGGEPAVTQGD